MHASSWQCLSTVLLGSHWYLNCVWYHNSHLSSVHCSKSLQAGVLDLLPYSLVSSWLFSSHPCLCRAQGPIPVLIHQMGPYQCQAEFKTLSHAELGSVHSVMLLPFMRTKSDRGLVVDHLPVPCVLPASHQPSKFGTDRGRTVNSQPFTLMVNFVLHAPWIRVCTYFFTHPLTVKHIFLRFFRRKQLKQHKKL